MTFYILCKEEKKIGQGSFVICEWDSVAKKNSLFQRAMASLERTMIGKCDIEWAPKSFSLSLALTPGTNNYGRTTILPALFDDHNGNVMDITGGGGNPVATWRQLLTTTGHQMLIQGSRAGETIPEDFKVAWAGLAFPNKNQHITELKWQIGDRKYGRVNIEEMQGYNKPAIIFEDGYILDEEESFHLFGYVEGPLPVHHDGHTGVYQRMVMLGFCTYKVVSKVLGTPGTAIP